MKVFSVRLAAICAAALPFAALVAHGGVVVYPEYDARIERDYAYVVRVWQGSEKKRLVVYNHCEKSALTTRTRGGDVNRRFCEFAFDGGPVQVDVAVCEDVKSYAVFPSRLGLKSAFQDGVISVMVDRPCNFGIRLNDYDKTILSVFADAPEDGAKVPKKGDPKVLYVEGWVDPPGEDGVTVVADPVKEVYIAPGAVLNSRLVVRSKGAYIHGRGMMLDPMSDIFRFDQTKNTRRGFLNVVADGAVVEDIKLVVSGVRTVRTQKNIAPKEKLTLQVVGASLRGKYGDAVMKMANLEAINEVKEKDASAQTFLVGTTEYAVPLGNLIDAEAEIKKAEAEIQRLEGFMAGIQKKLANERFVQNAPAQVVELERKKLADAESKITALRETVAALK